VESKKTRHPLILTSNVGRSSLLTPKNVDVLNISDSRIDVRLGIYGNPTSPLQKVICPVYPIQR